MLYNMMQSYIHQSNQEQGTVEDRWAKMEEVTGDKRKFYNEELHTLYSSRNTIFMIKSQMPGTRGGGGGGGGGVGGAGGRG